ncbi:hypothetical protein ACJJTC_005810 [Scirpophaga incertulas]
MTDLTSDDLVMSITSPQIISLGTSALHLAAGNAHLGTCGVLLRAGVSRDARTKTARTPLHVAARAGHAAAAALLLAAGALPAPRDALAMTPLHWAAARGHAAVAAVLLAHRAPRDAADKFHLTPLDLARRHHHPRLVRMLEDTPRPDYYLDHLTEEEAADIREQPIFATVQKIQDITVNPPIPQEEVTVTIEADKTMEQEQEQETDESEQASARLLAGVAEHADTGGAAALLRRHGITLLGGDRAGTVLRALRCGRSVVLSDAGKLLLTESQPQAAPDCKATLLFIGFELFWYT